MSFRFTTYEGFSARFAYLGLLSVLLTLPYAVPAILDVLRVRLGGTPGEFLYLLKPVENQLWYMILGFSTVLIPTLAMRAMGMSLETWPLRGRLLPWFVIGMALVQFLSAIQAPNTSFVLKSLMMQFVFYLAYFLAASSLNSRAALEKLLLLLLTASIPLSAYALAQSQGYEILPYSRTLSDANLEEIAGKQLIASTFGHPNYMAAYLAPLLFWAAYFFLIRRGLARWTAVVAGMLIIAALIVGGTRGPWVGILLAAFPFYFILTFVGAYRRPLLFSGGVAVVLALLILLVPNPFIRVQFDVSERLLGSKEIAARFYYWLMAIEMWKDHPLLGIGYSNFDVHFWSYVEAYQSRPQSEYYRYVLQEAIRGTRPGFVHNDHLQILAEGGTVAAGIWLGIWSTMAAQLYQLIRNIRDHSTLLVTATLFCTLLTVAIDGLFNFPLQVPVSGFLFWVTLGAWTSFSGQMRSGTIRTTD